MLSRRLGGLAGLGFIALVGSVNIILGAAGMPQPGASRAEVEEFFATSADTIALTSSLATLVWLCLPVFAAGVVTRLRQAPPERVESWPLLGLAAVIMQNAIFVGVVATQVVLATSDVSGDAAWVVWLLHNALFTLNGSSLALILVALSVAGLRAGLIRRWHGRLGLGAAAVLAVSSLTTPYHEDLPVFGMIGLVGFLGWLVWVGTYSIVLLRGTAPAVATEDRVAVPV
jgi:hypothetical protein